MKNYTLLTLFLLSVTAMNFPYKKLLAIGLFLSMLMWSSPSFITALADAIKLFTN